MAMLLLSSTQEIYIPKLDKDYCPSTL